MKYRIAIWATTGFLVAGWWALYFAMASKGIPIGPIVSALVRLSCPVAIAGSHFPISVYWVLAANVVTYVLVGLTVELLRRRLNHSK